MKSIGDLNVNLPKKSLEKFAYNVRSYFATVENDIHRIRPDEAIDIISALTAFKKYFESETEWERLTLCALNTLQKGVQRSMIDKIASFSGMTHLAYATNDLTNIAPALKPFHEGINKILLDNLDDLLKGTKKNDFYTEGNYEVIKGLSGPLSYLLHTCNDDDRMRDMVDRIIDILVRRAKDIMIAGYRVPGWHYYPSTMEKLFMTESAANGVINYGLSHGMAAPLVTLSTAYNKGFHNEGLVEAIDGLVSEFMKAHYYVNGIAYWPGRITFEQYIGIDKKYEVSGQMSWCYSSIGILRSLYLSGVLTSNSITEQFAQKELEKIAAMDLSDYALPQMIVCHGFVGTAAVLNAMYLDTGNVQFLQNTVKMIETCATMDTEQFFEHEKRVARGKNTPLRVDMHGHLEGYNGIIQTVLSILRGVQNGNDKRLLIA